jgi:uncharacterized protein (DUF885 family)
VRRLLPVLLLLVPALSASAQNNQAWIATSNGYTQKLLDIQARYSPEEASAQGLSKFDDKVTDYSLAAEASRRKEEEAAVARLLKATETEKDPNVLEDLHILIAAEQLGFRRDDYEREHMVPYFNATTIIYNGLKPLLDEQVPGGRRRAANDRLKRYVGIDPDPGGNKMREQPNMGRNAAASTGLANADMQDSSLVSALMRRTAQQMARPNMVYPAKSDIETQLARNVAILNGLEDLFKKYKLPNWEPAFAVLQREMVFYDDWVRKNLLPRARTDFREPVELYALNLERYGVDLPPDQLTAKAHAAFADYQAQMQPLAAEIAKEHNWPSSDYRDVIRQLKKEQIIGDAVLPLYEKHLGEIEKIIVDKKLVSLPTRPAIIRLATAAESAQQPVPYMDAPPLVHNTGQRGVFVLPLILPAGAGQAQMVKSDDFSYDAVTWTLIAHEARPGHELQFDSMVEHGVSLARAIYADNSTNTEGWGLYAESIMLPYMPKEGQLVSLQLRLMRAARAFLDPELQSGKIQPFDAMKILTGDVGLSAPFANSEVERYTFRSPGQAVSYFDGFTRLLELRKETEDALGPKFDQLRYHDFILAQGLLPPALMQQAVETQFIPGEKSH